VHNTITKLPNFYAPRETTHFDDSPARAPVEDGFVIIPGGKIVADDRNARGLLTALPRPADRAAAAH
jgi:hypothetical protein